jgi:glycolate oxidase
VDVIDLDLPNRRAVVGPGVVNAEISRLAADAGYFYAPDPSSQQVCSIGGNVAENSGGAHCLKYGFTTNHVTALEIVTPDGQVVTLGSEKAVDAPGYDLVGTIVGSEGTLGVVTAVSVRLVRLPERVETLLCAFETIDQAAEAVAAIVAAGIVPAAMEMMDTLSIEAAEAAVGCGYPRGAGAVLIIELDGPSPQVEDDITAVMGHCQDNRAFELRLAANDAERAQLWKGRKSAFAAMGRISADYIVQDGVVPRSALREVLHRIGELADEAQIRVANVFHAGDGNLHPLVLFDDAVAGEHERAEALSSAILDLCLSLGGSITGEHGVGVDKKAYMDRMFGEDDLETMHLLRCAFDPEGRCNPGKVFPTPRLCGEVPGHHRGVHPLQAAGIAEIF